MAGDLSFITKSKDDVLYLPVKFISSDQGKKFVKKQKNGKTEKAYILTGMETDEDIEIVNGLEEGDVVYK
jgi:HlyD family secretion protein/macrolide-specific efflux system membrane fusion protein